MRPSGSRSRRSGMAIAQHWHLRAAEAGHLGAIEYARMRLYGIARRARTADRDAVAAACRTGRTSAGQRPAGADRAGRHGAAARWAHQRTSASRGAGEFSAGPADRCDPFRPQAASGRSVAVPAVAGTRRRSRQRDRRRTAGRASGARRRLRGAAGDRRRSVGAIGEQPVRRGCPTSRCRRRTMQARRVSSRSKTSCARRQRAR